MAKATLLSLICWVRRGLQAIFLEGSLSDFRQMRWIWWIPMCCSPCTLNFRPLAVTVGFDLRMLFMVWMVAGVMVDFLPVPVFLFFTGRVGFFLANAKIRLRVDSDMLSWALMLFRGTLAFHNSIATLLVSREKWPMWPMLAASMSLQN